ncbi:MAG: hypothetical protein LBR70_05150 [Lactobacillaceae bacterium]|jgi:hypothetical protein|nr:hypothetical protein [Lactobacillaceae bacterium]
MTNIVSVKTNFTSGQISGNLFGRGDLGVYENGARCLENVIIHPTGGVSRRHGLKLLDELPCTGKLIPFEFNSEQEYLLCLLDYEAKVYREGECIAVMETPWGIAHHAKLSWTQSADTLLIVHPDVEPQLITRNNNELWRISAWEYYAKDGYIYCPYFNFYNGKVKLAIKAKDLSDAEGDALLVSDADIFSEGYVGVKIKINEGLLEVVEIESAKKANVKTLKKFKAATETADWEEQSFSEMRGFPCSVTFHQDRLVIGGSRSLPNRIWLSKSSDLFNFDLGTGLDDESIELAILADQVNAISNVVSSRHLLIFTTGSEWMLSGDVLTPTGVQISRQTNIGCYNKYSIIPEQVNGATVFLSYSGKQLREFLYADTEQAYLSKNLSLLSEDMLSVPICSAFNKEDSVLYVALSDGTISCLTTYRTEEVNAWSKLRTNGSFKSLAICGDDMYFIIQRKNHCFLEKFEKGFHVDCGRVLTSDEPKAFWKGFDDFEGEILSVVSNDFYLGKYKVENGSIALFEETSEIIAGMPFEHVVEPLPYMVDAMRPYTPNAVKAISSVFKLLKTKSFFISLGHGYMDVPLKRIFKDNILDAPAKVYSGDVELRSIWWIRSLEDAIWSIRSDVPLPFNLLSVVMKLKIKD